MNDPNDKVLPVSKRKLTLVHSKDWMGLYLDGILAIQRQDLHAVDVLDLLKDASICEVQYMEQDSRQLKAEGRLPDRLKHVSKAGDYNV